MEKVLIGDTLYTKSYVIKVLSDGTFDITEELLGSDGIDMVYANRFNRTIHINDDMFCFDVAVCTSYSTIINENILDMALQCTLQFYRKQLRDVTDFMKSTDMIINNLELVNVSIAKTQIKVKKGDYRN